jgi:hypothetical protein
MSRCSAAGRAVVAALTADEIHEAVPLHDRVENRRAPRMHRDRADLGHRNLAAVGHALLDFALNFGR